ncbi:unnamed protein product [Phytomonas sp. EM1]|nr:unnamed protein product [Phytomonas sp. EM1]|eukprot:CCW59803.1 unnamed protein product [Phytomonas sp. isolate EM1]
MRFECSIFKNVIISDLEGSLNLLLSAQFVLILSGYAFSMKDIDYILLIGTNKPFSLHLCQA